MPGFIVMGEDAERMMVERYNAMRKDFIKDAANYGLDPSKDYDLVCLSFEPGQRILKVVQDKLTEWPTGKVRGYINEFDNLCINIPMTQGENTPENEDIFSLLQRSMQEYFDFESSNWECYAAPFPENIVNIDALITAWNEATEQ